MHEMKSGTGHVLPVQKKYTGQEKAPQLKIHMFAHALIYMCLVD